ncbi:MAG: type IV toxin-antitoxin system AbiEi family antitoxin domain-containing protein, partial [Actinomycetota bacterium]|nr:type IV toxin-antitoxin system AbiEi family antitoxin domain-containing protein [Actinomycetota bacterium]
STAKDIFTMEAAERFWGSGSTTRNVLSRLESKGWLERLERGKYMLVPLEAGVDREWSEDPLAIGSFLVPSGGAAYWTAVRHWGWTTQLPRTQFFITARRRASRGTYLGVPYRFITLKPDRVFGLTQEWVEGLAIRVTNRERTLLDILDRPDLAGGIAEVSAALKVSWRDVDPELLMEYIERFGSGTVPKRLGYLAEELDLDGVSDWTQRWRSMMGTGITLLERGGPKSGRILTRWGLQINAGKSKGVR